QCAMKVKTKIPEAVLVFVVAPSMETLIRRLRDRKTETEEKIQSRIRQMKTEFTYIPKYDYLLVNDDLDDAVRRLDEIIRTNASRVAENGEMLKDIENYLGGLS
ncbi:MAG: guanylate kinase, partial [Eubacterium sp.]|nr:guanylate kinase [Eubacterium sp.]